MPPLRLCKLCFAVPDGFLLPLVGRFVHTLYNSHAPAAKRPYIGHYGHLRKAYLEQYRPDLYTALVASEKLYEHCAEINEAAQRRIDLIMPELAKSAGATEDLKRRPLAWLGLMNACRAQADEIVKFELVYD